MRRILVGLLATLAARPALAERWAVDYAKSRLGFAVQWSGAPFSAAFHTWSADIDFEPADLAHSRASVTVNLASEFSDEPDFDSGLKGVEGFATAQFPEARFVVSNFIHTRADAYVAAGSLSLHGVSREIRLPFTLAISGGTAHVTGTAHVKRTDFALGQGEWSGPDPVAYDVAITIDLVATK